MPNDPIKKALRMMPYGFYSITSKRGDDANAMVANWVMQVSLEPRLIAFGLAKSAYSHDLIADSGAFCINIFNEDDSEALMPFTKARAKNPEKMADASYDEAPETGCPILEGASAYVECRVKQIIDIGGDHDMVIAEPVGAGVRKEFDAAEALTLPKLGWSYAG
jgi:flavin reductase (DIM6/NTAB) family NADH-FMN oxidoreductase RutF